jgi:hypothetical protein
LSEPRVAQILLEYQPFISQMPVAKDRLYAKACENDGATVEHWKKTWIANITANKKRFGSFHDHSVAKVFGKYKHGAAIIAGSGPSLKFNAAKLKDRREIPLISCLHNFHYFEELELAPEFYCSLDAGNDITTEEVTEGGTKDEQWYWDRTKERTLIAYIGTSPKLLEKWQGEILFFNSALPTHDLNQEIDAIESFKVYFSTGGNVLGACLYLTRAVLGCYTIIFTGADFSFGYPDCSEKIPVHRFHSWKSKYDSQMGQTVKVTDVFGNKVHTWPSYFNFKSYFDWFAANVPGSYINATEGGCLGAYDQGNIDKFKYMSLEEAMRSINAFYALEEPLYNRDYKNNQVLYI